MKQLTWCTANYAASPNPNPRICFYLDFTASQDYFIHFQPSQSVAKMGDPLEKTPDHPQAENGLSHMTWARLKPTVRWQAI